MSSATQVHTFQTQALNRVDGNGVVLPCLARLA
jgi:hypothetical protein